MSRISYWGTNQEQERSLLPTLFLRATSWRNLEILFLASIFRQADLKTINAGPALLIPPSTPPIGRRSTAAAAIAAPRSAAVQLVGGSKPPATSQPIRGGGEKFLWVTLSRVQLQTPLTSNSASPEFDLPVEILPVLRWCWKRLLGLSEPPDDLGPLDSVLGVNA